MVSNKVIMVKFPLSTDNEADVSSISPSSQQMRGMWVVHVYTGVGGAIPLVEK